MDPNEKLLQDGEWLEEDNETSDNKGDDDDE